MSQKPVNTIGEEASVIVAGSRSITDFDVVHNAIVESPFWPLIGGEIVTGGAPGVDQHAKDFAIDQSVQADFDVSYEEFEADWDEHGKAAGPIRNEEMAEYADALIAVWDGESNGTRSMIEKALDYGLDVYVTVIEQ